MKIRNIVVVFMAMIVGMFACLGCIHLFGNKSDEVKLATTDLKSEIKEIGELATAEYVYTLSNIVEKPKYEIIGISIPFTGSKVLYSYSGVVKAGIQFADLGIDINDKQKKIYVSIPEASVLSSEVDFDSLVIYDEEYSIFNMFMFEDLNLSVSTLKKTAEKTAADSGLLLTAKENAKTVIKSSIAGIGSYSEYEVVFY